MAKMKFSGKKFAFVMCTLGVWSVDYADAALKPTAFPGTINDIPFADRQKNKQAGYEPYKNLKAYDVPEFKPNDDEFYKEVLAREGKETLCRIKPNHDECQPSITYNFMGGTKVGECPKKYRRTETTVVNCSVKRDRSIFRGWSRDTGCTNPQIAPVIGPTESGDIVFHACWKCVDNANAIGNKCVCNDIAMDDNCKCTGAFLELDTSTKMCKCLSYSDINGFQDGVAYVDQAAKQCKCVDPTMDVTRNCEIPLQCPDPQHMDSACKCFDGMEKFGNQCQCVSADGSTINPRKDRESSCMCIDAQFMNEANDCACAPNTEFDVNTKKCLCTDPTKEPEPTGLDADGKAICEDKDNNNNGGGGNNGGNNGGGGDNNELYYLFQCRTDKAPEQMEQLKTGEFVNPVNAVGCNKDHRNTIKDCFAPCMVYETYMSQNSNAQENLQKSRKYIVDNQIGRVNQVTMQSIPNAKYFCTGTVYAVNSAPKTYDKYDNYDTLQDIYLYFLRADKVEKSPVTAWDYNDTTKINEYINLLKGTNFSEPCDTSYSHWYIVVIKDTKKQTSDNNKLWQIYDYVDISEWPHTN